MISRAISNGARFVPEHAPGKKLDISRGPKFVGLRILAVPEKVAIVLEDFERMFDGRSFRQAQHDQTLVSVDLDGPVDSRFRGEKAERPIRREEPLPLAGRV